MILTCGNCGKKLNIPDSKVPSGKVFSIKCPSCGNKVSSKSEKKPGTDLPKGEEPAKATEEAKEVKKPTLDLDIGVEIKKQESMEDYLEEFGPGELTALVCDKINTSQIEEALKELGYRMSIAENSTVAVNKIKFNRYDLILIDENFDDFTLKENPVFLHVQPMAIAERRNIIVVLIGDQFKTTDLMTAFAMSVNMVVNSKDVKDLANLLKRTIQDNEQFYKIFKEALVAAGKG